MSNNNPAIWFPTIRTGTGTDAFTERLVAGLKARGIHADLLWLPPHAEYAPWSVPVPKPPVWANVAHINSWLPPRFVPKDIPIVVTVHHGIHDARLNPYKSYLQRVYHKLWVRHNELSNFSRSAAITAVSQYVASQIGLHFGRQDAAVIYNGIDTSGVFARGPERFPHSPFRLIYVGNWKPLKGVDLLAPIMEQLGEGFELFYTSDSSGRDTRYRLPPNCRCIGRLDSLGVAQAFRNADVLLFPSRSEGLGLGVIEAMACGLPAVVSDVSALPEVVEHGVTGLLCPVDDVNAFVASVATLARDLAGWRAMRLRAAERARMRFSASDAVNAYIALYGSITG